ncbi:hypothetical protein B0H13DRAFT_2381646 [Mycena leptocephala]|nr:hypothetical protein B0H13DRAFT_2381646 [Mycena leptocephala]
MSTSSHEDMQASSSRPRMSTPPRGIHDEKTVPDFEASAEFEDVPLRNYDGPVLDTFVDTAAPVLKIQVKVPTLRPLAKIGNNTQILARRTEALTKGATGTGKDFLVDVSRASRRETPPPLPSWGNNEDILSGYNENSFEILGVCFRAEVENFLVPLDKYWDYPERKPQTRHAELDEAADGFIGKSRTPGAASRFEDTSRSISHREDQADISKASESTTYPLRNVSTVRFGAIASGNELSRHNERMGEILNYGTDISVAKGTASCEPTYTP